MGRTVEPVDATVRSVRYQFVMPDVDSNWLAAVAVVAGSAITAFSTSRFRFARSSRLRHRIREELSLLKELPAGDDFDELRRTLRQSAGEASAQLAKLGARREPGKSVGERTGGLLSDIPATVGTIAGMTAIVAGALSWQGRQASEFMVVVLASLLSIIILYLFPRNRVTTILSLLFATAAILLTTFQYASP